MRRRDLLTAAALALAIAGAAAAPASAADAPTDPAKQTSWGLYLDAREAAAMKQQMGDGVLFVDVRDPIEAMFTGFASMVDVNVPLLLADRTEWHPEKPVFAMKPNARFAEGIEAALAARGLDKSAPVILMCRSGGERGAPSAKALEGLGYDKVYVVVDGFEGSTADAKDAPWRNVDGWKNAGLPWSYKLDKSKFSLRE